MSPKQRLDITTTMTQRLFNKPFKLFTFSRERINQSDAMTWSDFTHKKTKKKNTFGGYDLIGWETFERSKRPIEQPSNDIAK